MSSVLINFVLSETVPVVVFKRIVCYDDFSTIIYYDKNIELLFIQFMLLFKIHKFDLPILFFDFLLITSSLTQYKDYNKFSHWKKFLQTTNKFCPMHKSSVNKQILIPIAF